MLAQIYAIENSTVVGRYSLRIVPLVVDRSGSGVRVSASFQCCSICHIYSANICLPFTAILSTVPVA